MVCNVSSALYVWKNSDECYVEWPMEFSLVTGESLFMNTEYENVDILITRWLGWDVKAHQSTGHMENGWEK